MADYRLSGRALPLHEGYDVIVADGGPAGCAAAVSAARAGCKTLLIEQSDMLGGAGTRCLVNTWTPMTDRVRVIYAGIAYEVFRLALGRTPYVDPRRIDWVPVDAEALKSVYDDLTQEAGVDVLFGTRLCAAEREGGRVTALVCANQAGLARGARRCTSTARATRCCARSPARRRSWATRTGRCSPPRTASCWRT